MGQRKNKEYNLVATPLTPFQNHGSVAACYTVPYLHFGPHPWFIFTRGEGNKMAKHKGL